MTTAAAVSPYNDVASVAVSLVVFTLLYGVLAVVWYGLMRRYTLEGAPPADQNTPTDLDAPLAFAY